MGIFMNQIIISDVEREEQESTLSCFRADLHATTHHSRGTVGRRQAGELIYRYHIFCVRSEMKVNTFISLICLNIGTIITLR